METEPHFDIGEQRSLVSEELNSVETVMTELEKGKDVEFQKNLIVWKPISMVARRAILKSFRRT